MALRIHIIPRASLPGENTVLAFDVNSERYVVADVDGDIQAYRVVGPSADSADRAAVVEGRLRCPLHGWPIDPVDGQCGAAERCRYWPVAVEADAAEIRVSLPSP